MTYILTSVQMKSKSVSYAHHFTSMIDVLIFVKSKHARRWTQIYVTVLPD